MFAVPEVTRTLPLGWRSASPTTPSKKSGVSRHSKVGVTSPVQLWWDIQPISAGLFGVPIGFAVIILVSLVTPAPSRKIQELVEFVRYPNLKAS